MLLITATTATATATLTTQATTTTTTTATLTTTTTTTHFHIICGIFSFAKSKAPVEEPMLHSGSGSDESESEAHSPAEVRAAPAMRFGSMKEESQVVTKRQLTMRKAAASRRKSKDAKDACDDVVATQLALGEAGLDAEMVQVVKKLGGLAPSSLLSLNVEKILKEEIAPAKVGQGINGALFSLPTDHRPNTQT
jgi:hypothetical protein